jgi:hypothetical protein
MMSRNAPVFVFCKRQEANLVTVYGCVKVAESGDLVAIANPAGVHLRQEQRLDQ